MWPVPSRDWPFGYRVAFLLANVGAILFLAGCASFLAWNAGLRTMSANCDALDEEKCNPSRASSSFCCDQYAGWHCNGGGRPADSPYPGRCEYSGEQDHGPAYWCGGPLGCRYGAAPDGGRDAGH